MNALLLLTNVALVLASAVLILSFLSVRGKTAVVLGVYILSFADVVLILELAGLLGALNRWSVLVIQVILTLMVGLMWDRAGRPALLQPFRGIRLDRLWNGLRSAPEMPLLIVLAACIGYVYLLSLQKALFIPPNNYDSLTYHLSRVAYWLQYESFYPWPTPNLRQTALPMNAELGLLWTILWWGTDRLTGLVQFSTVPAIMAGIYGLARLLGYARFPALFAALLWATLGQVLYQSSSTQNDLVTSVFWVGTIYFLLLGIRERALSPMWLSGTALGLALGAKGTSLIALPGFVAALALVFWLCCDTRTSWMLLARWGLISLLGTVLLGLYVFVQNTLAFGHPLGPTDAYHVKMFSLESEGFFQTHLIFLRDNLGRYVYQIVDFSTLPFNAASGLNPIRRAVLEPVFDVLGVSLDNPGSIERAAIDFDYLNPHGEDNSWFGPLGVFLLPVLVYQGFRGLRQRDAPRIALSVTAVGFLLVQSGAQGWTPAKGRYFMIMFALAFPMLAALLDFIGIRRRLLTLFIALVGLTAMFTVAGRIGQPVQLTWQEALTGQRREPPWTGDANYRMILENVPENASIGVWAGGDFRDYPLFGERFTRSVVYAPEGALLPAVEIGSFRAVFEQSDYLMIARAPTPYIDRTAADSFSLLSRIDAVSLWIRQELRAPGDCYDGEWPFSVFYEGTVEAPCPRFPLVLGLSTSAPGGRFQPEIGIGAEQGLAFDMLVQEPVEVQFSVLVEPVGIPSEQTLQFVVAAPDSDPQMLERSFGRKGWLMFDVSLDAGVHTVQFFLSDDSAGAYILKIRTALR